MKSSLTTNFDIMYRPFIGYFLYTMLAVWCGFETFVTIEPILDFNLNAMVDLLKQCNPEQVNIGADSGRNNLPEPSREKVLQLVSELQKFTVIHNKSNLQRLL